LPSRLGIWNNAAMDSATSAEPRARRRVSVLVAACVKVGLGLALLAALFHYGSIDLASLRALAQRPGAVVATGLLILLTLPLAALRWSIILRVLGVPLPWRPVLHVQAMSSFAGQYILGVASADAVRGFYAWRALGGNSPRIAVSLVADRALSLATMVLLAMLCLLLRLDRVLAVPALSALLVSVALSLAAMTLGVMALFLAPAVLTRLEALSSGLPRVAWLLAQAGTIVGAFRTHLVAATAAFAVAFAVNVVNILSVMVIALSLQIGSLGAVDYLVAAPLALIANALPLTPGGLGVGEVAFDQVCGWLDVARSGAGYAGVFFAWRAVSMLVTLVGLVSFVMHRSDAVHTSAK
jgi:uncharacterized membrane protein YbhN (UPF0104 family)